MFIILLEINSTQEDLKTNLLILRTFCGDDKILDLLLTTKHIQLRVLIPSKTMDGFFRTYPKFSIEHYFLDYSETGSHVKR